MGFKQIKNVRVLGLPESLIASGYPMQNGEPDDMCFCELTSKDFDRAEKLGQVKTGTGHDNYLKGIVVQFDWKLSQVMYPQVERYHWLEIVSSQSKMHRIQLAKVDQFNDLVDPAILERFMEMVAELDTIENPTWYSYHLKKLYYSCPMGYEMWARFSTNYLQLKTIYQQRKNHKLDEWKDFCKWCEGLPNFMELTQKGD